MQSPTTRLVGLNYALGKYKGLPWKSGGYDSVLPLLGVQIQFLIQELRSHMGTVQTNLFPGQE